MRRNDQFADGQPQPHAFAFGIRRRIVHFEQVRKILFPYARTVVADTENRVFARIPHFDPDIAVVVRVFCCVVQNIAEHLE